MPIWPTERLTGRLVALFALFVLGCVSSSVVPASLQQQVDPNLTFAQLRDSPDSYRGRVVVLGGEVLSAKRLKTGTRIEVLQLPLGGSQQPETDRTRSEGRFLAMQRDFLDPATIPPGTRVTITGEVTSAMVLPLDETEYTYPVLELKHLKVWPKDDGTMSRPNSPYGSSYWAPYRGLWGRPYWW